MTALDELLRDGKLGTLGVAALYGAVSAVARFDHYPPPEGHQRWDADAVRDVAAGFVASQRASERLMQLAIKATDDDSFGRLLEAAVRNYFRSDARRTAGGKLSRRLRSVLAKMSGIVAIGDDVFALENHLEPTSRGLIDALIPATWAADIGPASGQLDADGNVKVSRVALERLCRAVMEAAGGPLNLDELAYVIGARLGLREPPLTFDVDAPGPTAERHPEDEAITAVTAEELFEALSDRERIALIVLEDSVRDAASFAGIGKSSMAETMSRLRAKLAQLLPDDKHRGPVLARAVEMAVSWAGEHHE